MYRIDSAASQDEAPIIQTYTPSGHLLRVNASLVSGRKLKPTHALAEKIMPPPRVEQALVLSSWLARTQPGQPTQSLATFLVPNKLAGQPQAISPTAPLQALLSTSPTYAENLTLHPSLAVAILKSETAVPARLWLVARHIDRQGGGMWHISDLIERFTHKQSVLRICGPRRLRQILKQGADLFWQRDNSGRIFMRSLANVLVALSCTSLSGKPVSLPINHLLGGMQSVRATLYGVFHAGRKTNNPISRETLSALLGLSSRAQCNYDSIAGVKKIQQTAVGGTWEKGAVERAYFRRQGVFKFSERNKDGSLTSRIAWRLPNQYTPAYKQVSCGGIRTLTKRVQVLVSKRAQLNHCEQATSTPCKTSVFCQKATELKQLLGRDNDVYWREGKIWLQMTLEK